MAMITVNEQISENHVVAGEKIMQNNEFLKDICELMENEQFKSGKFDTSFLENFKFET